MKKKLLFILSLFGLTVFSPSSFANEEKCHPYPPNYCPLGAEPVDGLCYCMTTGKMVLAVRGEECPPNPACEGYQGENPCDGNSACCCSIKNKIHQGAKCRGCMQLSQESCEYLGTGLPEAEPWP